MMEGESQRKLGSLRESLLLSNISSGCYIEIYCGEGVGVGDQDRIRAFSQEAIAMV